MNQANKYLKREFLEDQKLIILSVTKRCNLYCQYCRTKDEWYDVLGQKSETIDIPKRKWRQVLNICQNANAGEVLVTGGEPVEYPLLKEFLQFLSENKIRFSLHTNGISKKWFDILNFFRNNNLHPDIHLSIELFEDLQKEMRSGSSLPLQFIAGVKKLGLLLELKINLHQKLLSYKDRLKENLYSWAERRIDSIFFQPIVPVGKNFPSELEINKSFIPFLLELKKLKLEDPVLSKVIRKSAIGIDVIISFIEQTNLYKEIAEKCDVCNQIIFINPDLKILNCKTLWERERNAPCSKFFDFICCGFQP
jgi:MoaA/NifB/PqqE/SkfB family radical SAM enzyme